MIGMTPKQAALYSFIKSYKSANGCAPSFDEMKDAIGTKAKSNIHRYLEGLERRGLVRRNHKLKRSVEIIDATAEMAFFETLPSGTRHIIRTIAIRERVTNETVMREWIRERAESFRTPFVEQLSA
jgi:SOS-response transcriptional repressor LexA